MQDIKYFYFNPKISGQVLSSMLKSRGISITSAADSTGIMYDTLRKCLSGDVQRVSLDTIFKVCKITGYTMADYLQRYFEADQTDIFSDVLSSVPDKSSVSPCQGIEYVKSHIDVLQAQHTAKIVQQYETIIAELHEQVAQLKEGRQLMHTHYQRTTDHLYDEIKKLEAENAELSAIITKRHRHTGEK